MNCFFSSTAKRTVFYPWLARGDPNETKNKKRSPELFHPSVFLLFFFFLFLSRPRNELALFQLLSVCFLCAFAASVACIIYAHTHISTHTHTSVVLAHTARASFSFPPQFLYYMLVCNRNFTNNTTLPQAHNTQYYAVYTYTRARTACTTRSTSKHENNICYICITRYHILFWRTVEFWRDHGRRGEG